jgi:hypothetical protein
MSIAGSGCVGSINQHSTCKDNGKFYNTLYKDIVF